ncbi:uncharacterized protein Bfra_009087 [Botrytis fragariae]|uniref:Uncharacterized protein n=1 Tax=Botrytis fragariae TaxID=1964551 RepID=A0A8H6ARB7_9HELO|nr:uncharacterized protein Bfra_009087 [Botrytis fragariae]KAF5872059.1 hypothetical protein Bfra_009087 [Botrytis fragariae]
MALNKINAAPRASDSSDFYQYRQSQQVNQKKATAGPHHPDKDRLFLTEFHHSLPASAYNTQPIFSVSRYTASPFNLVTPSSRYFPSQYPHHKAR